MRKFNFDNLAILNGEYDLRDQLLLDAVTAPSLDLNVFAPQPGPLFATINGTSGDDVLNGTSGDDILIGGAGNDIINGGDGIDIAVFSASGDYRVIDLGNGDAYVRMLFEVGDGLDLLTGIETLRFDGINGTDFALSTLAVAADINGTSGDDTLLATGGDIVLGFAGNDTITGTNLSSAEIYAGAGDDIVTTASNSSGDFIFVYGDVGNDTLNIGRVNFGTIEGGDGNDILNIDFSQNSIVNGGAGDDTFNITEAFDTSFSGGAGNDDVGFSFQNETSADLTGGAGIDILRTSMDFQELDTINRFGGTIDITNNVTAGDYSELTLSGGFEVLIASGGGETDTLRGGSGNDVLEDGGFWAEDEPGSFFYGNGGNDFLYGMAGDDVIIGTGGQDILSGGDGDDVITSGGHYVQGFIDGSGGSSSETIISRAVMIGGEGNDVLNSYGVDTLEGGEGDDTLTNHGNSATAIYSSANEADYIFTETAMGEYTVEAIGGTGEGTDTLTGVETIRLGGINGTDYAIASLVPATIALTAGDDIYSGPSTDVIVNALDGNDIIDGGAGNNTLNGDAGNDTLISLGNDILNGGTGNDTVEMGGNVFDAATVTDGGADIDTISFSTLAQLPSGNLFLVLDLQGQAYSLRDGSTVLYVDQFTNFENATGSEFGDLLQGDAGANLLSGLGGDDNLQGRDGDDTIEGGAGDDILNGGAGADILNGGSGTDTLSYAGSNTGILINLRTGTVGGAAAGDVFSSIENVIGTDFNDNMTGTFFRNLLMGGGGDDIINRAGGAAQAVYLSSNREDYIFAQDASGNNTVTAIGGTGEGVDTLIGVGSIILGGMDGTAYNFQSLRTGVFYLFSSDDVFEGISMDETIHGRGGDDIIDGGAGNNTLNGDAGNDTLISLGNDILNGGTGNDLIEMGGNVFDTATGTDGGDGIDTISFSTLAQLPSGNLFLVIDLFNRAYSVRDGSAVLYVDQFFGFENATGSESGDLLQGNGAGNILRGLGGDDNLQGRGGDDVFDGGAGADLFDGGDGIDLATYASALAGVTAIIGGAWLNRGDAAGDGYVDVENITGSSFDDILGGDENANIIDGGDGIDIASYAYAASAIVFDGLGLVTASGDIVDDTLLNIEGIGGTDFNDRLFGDNDASIFYGGAGADRLFGRNGDDQLFGEDGDDIILAGRDNDLLDGGAGNDQLRGNEGDDTIFGGDGNDVLAGGAGADAMDGGAGIDRVEYTYGTNAGVTASLGDASINTGDAAGDTYVNIENLYGTSFVDTLYGDAGNNRIDGRLGDDMLFGGDGNDYLIGGAGNDVLNGEGGNDLFLGQAGADIYQFDAAHGTDRIVVFTQGEDLIEFTEGVFDFSGLTITQDGAHVNIVSSEGTVIVNNSLVADFAADDFTFATPPSNEPLNDMFAHDVVDVMMADVGVLI